MTKAANDAKSLVVRSKDECKWDEVSLGEVMLRLDPGDVRVATARQFNVWEGGGEYNVARGLRRCFGLKTAIVVTDPDHLYRSSIMADTTLGIAIGRSR